MLDLDALAAQDDSWFLLPEIFEQGAGGFSEIPLLQWNRKQGGDVVSQVIQAFQQRVARSLDFAPRHLRLFYQDALRQFERVNGVSNALRRAIVQIASDATPLTVNRRPRLFSAIFQVRAQQDSANQNLALRLFCQGSV